MYLRRRLCHPNVYVVVAAFALLVLAIASPSAFAAGEPGGVHINQPMRISDANADAGESALTANDDAATAGSVIPKNDEPLLRRPSKMSHSSEHGTSGVGGIQLPKTSLFDTFWPMLVVLGIIVACGAAVKKWLPQATRVSGGSAVNILARQYVSSKQSLCLVKVGKRVVLVGVTPEAMTTLTEIVDSEEIASLAASLNRGKSGSFSAALSRQSVEAGDDATEDEYAPAPVQPRGGRMGETEARIRDLVGRIRAMSTGSPQ